MNKIEERLIELERQMKLVGEVLPELTDLVEKCMDFMTRTQKEKTGKNEY